MIPALVVAGKSIKNAVGDNKKTMRTYKFGWSYIDGDKEKGTLL